MRFARKAPLISVALTVSILAMSATAADSVLPNLSSAAQSAAAAATNTASNAPPASNTQSGSKGSNTAAVSVKESTTGKNGNQQSTSIQSSTVVISNTGAVISSLSETVPIITGGSSATTGGALPTGLPTLSGAFKIVPASVPPTAGAPFMRVSHLPEGTVFIAVGAILGFLAMSVLLWRGLVAWSLHRSVKRAAMHQNMADTKAHFRTPAAPFYNYADRDSTISLSGLVHKGGRKGGRPTTAAGAQSTSSLFFSPTAGAANAGLNNAGNRGSNYLPAGYYAAGASAPGNGQGMAHIGSGHGNSISLSNLGPQRDGYSRARSMGPSPPDSPAIGHGNSSSTLNLNVPPGEQRAPSAYLEDLFDGDSTHGAGPMPPPHNHSRSPSGYRF